jgi:hypothetical protein
VTLQEVGSDVVATGSGPLSLTGLSLIESNTQAAGGIIPLSALVTAGPSSATWTFMEATSTVPQVSGMGRGRNSPVARAISYGSVDRMERPSSGCPPVMYLAIRCRAHRSISTRPLPVLARIPVLMYGRGDAGPTRTLRSISATGTTEPPPPSVPEPSSVTLLGMGLGVLLLAGAIRRVRPGV